MQVIIVDEAHRLKCTTAATREAIEGCRREFLLLLTGTALLVHVHTHGCKQIVVAVH